MRSNILPELAWLSLVMIFSLSSANAKSTLTWETCLKDLIQNNPELSASEEGIAVSAAKKRASFSGFFPQLAATANLNRDNSGIASDGSATPRDLLKDLIVRFSNFLLEFRPPNLFFPALKIFTESLVRRMKFV